MQFTSESVQRYVRIGLQYLAAYLVTHGTVSANAVWVEPIIGICVGIATLGWSVYGNRINAILAEAAKAPNTVIVTDKETANSIPLPNVISNTENKVTTK